MNTGYLIYQAERRMSDGELRAADAYRGELAAGLARLPRSLAARLRLRSRLRPWSRSRRRATTRAGVCAR